MAIRHGTNDFVWVHLCTEFVGPKTSLTFFGSGLGDMSVIYQIGETFLDMCDCNQDPELGNVVFSLGSSISALHPTKGDYNIWMCWGNKEEWIKNYFKKTKNKPDFVWCLSSNSLDEVIRDYDICGWSSPLGVGKMFKPLHLKRDGLCYSGMSDRTHKEMRTVLYPVMKRPDFEWRKSNWVSLEKLNEWYNSKLATFGVVSDLNRIYGMLTSKVCEVFASGTPLIYPVHQGFKEWFGIDYRYQTDSPQKTLDLINEILNNPEHALKYMEVLSEMTINQHSYESKLETLFFLLRSV